MPSQMVGTPPVRVTRSRCEQIDELAGSRCGPGSTILAPTIAAANGRPHALAWNIGTTGSTASASQMPMHVGLRRGRSVCSTSERCE